MKLVKLQFLRNGVESGKEYTYMADDETLKPGDIVQVSEPPMGMITQVDVPEEEVAAFKDKLKKIVGRKTTVLDENAKAEPYIVDGKMIGCKFSAKESED